MAIPIPIPIMNQTSISLAIYIKKHKVQLVNSLFQSD